MQAQLQRHLKCKGSNLLNVLVVYLEDLFPIVFEIGLDEVGGGGGGGGGGTKKVIDTIL